MLNSIISAGLRQGTVLLMLAALCLLGGRSTAASLASIKVLGISAGDVATSASAGYDIRSSGLNTVGINKMVYLEPVPVAATASQIKSYVWSITSQPAPGSASVLINSNKVFKFRPTALGRYNISLTPINQSDTATTPSTISIWVSTYMGAQGDWSCATCHDGFYLEDKLTPWLGTGHAKVMQRDLDGEHGPRISSRCMSCHSTGSYEDTRGDEGFYDVARNIGFDLNLIAVWSADAANNGNKHWNDLPDALKARANVQCESCHGPGKTHNGGLNRISTPSYDATVCIACHDGPPHHNNPDMWRASKHFESNLVSSSAVNGVCNSCHTAEGFVAKQVNRLPDIDSAVKTRSNISCLGCHDPHSAANPHQLRKVNAVTLPNGRLFDFGLGNLCASCHHSRVASAADAIDLVKGNARGSHHGPQADILLGTSAYDWGYAYPSTVGPHYLAVEEGCVSCHMATPPANTTGGLVGSHTFEINDKGSGVTNVVNACDECHPGLTTTNRLPRIPRDFDGNGKAEGIESEFDGLMQNLRDEITIRCAGTTYDPKNLRLSISTDNWKKLSLNQRAAIYNFNILSVDRSRGIHNSRYAFAVVQRTYYYLTGRAYTGVYLSAYLVDTARNDAENEWDMYE